MHIRIVQEKDASELYDLARNFSTSFKVEKLAFDDSLRRLIVAPDACLAVAEIEGKIIGYVLGFDHDTLYANGRVSWVEEIMVSAAFRRQNIGRQLMKYFEDWARIRNSRLVALATRRAAVFYKAAGYEESATYFRKLI